MEICVRFAQIRDRVETDATTARGIDTSALTGIWVNSNPDSNGIARMVIHKCNGNVTLQVFAIGPDGLIDWGTADVTVFASAPLSTVSAGFTCCYDFGFVEVRLQGMLLKGLMVLAELHNFKDDSKRVDFFVREYFVSDHGKYRIDDSRIH
jgi:hypothetical protein